MPRMMEKPKDLRSATTQRTVEPSIPDPFRPQSFTLQQELEEFGRWTSKPIWVPPKNSSEDMAATMLSKSRLMDGREKRWAEVEKHHRGDFTQVREFELFRDSIRLPKGKLFVTITERENFDQIEETIPACVQTRLDEFLEGLGRRRGVKVYYLKPLCVEVDDQLIFTTSEDLHAAIREVQDDVFSEYLFQYWISMPRRALLSTANLALAPPRAVINYFVQRRKRQIDAYQAKLEFERRKTALSAVEAHNECRSDGCSFDQMLALTNPLERTDVIGQYCADKELSDAHKRHLVKMAATGMPWFVALSFSVAQIASLSLATATPTVVACDPVFVAEMPGAEGTLLKIGHFDEVAGVTHIEI